MSPRYIFIFSLWYFLSVCMGQD